MMLMSVEGELAPPMTAWDYFPDSCAYLDRLVDLVGERIEIVGEEIVHHPPRRWVLIVKKLRSLFFCQGDSIIYGYSCSVGDEKRGKATPAGWFRVINKIENPVMVWESGEVIPSGDWRNSFGYKWMGLGDWFTGRVTDYGIHGTNSPEAIGREISLGCVRMYNRDADALFESVETGTLVVVR